MTPETMLLALAASTSILNMQQASEPEDSIFI